MGHQHASTTRIALPLDTMTAAAHTHVSATSHSAARSSLLHAQRVTSGQSSRLTSVVQLPDALSVHQTTPPRHTLHQLSLQPSMFTPHHVSAPPSQSVPLTSSPRSTRLMSAAAATSVSHRTARRSSALSQFHAAHTARISASTRLMIAAVLTLVSATPQSALTLVIAHAQKAQLPVSSIPTAVAQFRSASQFIPLALPH